MTKHIKCRLSDDGKWVLVTLGTRTWQLTHRQAEAIGMQLIRAAEKQQKGAYVPWKKRRAA